MTSTTRKLTHPFMRTFDTHKYIKLLKSKGVKEQQAEIFVQAISDSRDADFANLATKEQVAIVKTQVDHLEKDVKDIREDIKDIREDMKDFRKEIRTMFRWAVGMTITGLAATATMLALVLPLLLKH